MAERLLPGVVASRVLPLFVRLDSLFNSRDEQGHAGRASLIAFAIRIASAAIALVSQVLMARWMGGFDYGIFVLVWTVMVMAGDISCLGFQTSIIRFIPEYREQGRLPELRGVIAAARIFVLVMSGIATALALAGVFLFSDAIENYYLLPFYLGLACLPVIALSDVLEGIARANGWSGRALGPIYILRPLLILLLMAGAVLAGFAPSATVAVICAVAATFLATFYQLATIMPPAMREVKAQKPRYLWHHWVSVSLPIFLVAGFFYLHTNADILMIGWFMQPEDVAVYFAVLKLLALVHFVYFAVKAGVAQRYAQYAHSGQHDALATFARQTVAWTFWPSLAMALVMIVLGKPMLALFGEGFSSGYLLLFPLMAGVVARAFVGPAESVLTMSGHQKTSAIVFAITLALNLALNFMLIPLWGLWGAAIATATAMLVEASLLAFAVYRKLGIIMLVPFGRR